MRHRPVDFVGTLSTLHREARAPTVWVEHHRQGLSPEARKGAPESAADRPAQASAAHPEFPFCSCPNSTVNTIPRQESAQPVATYMSPLNCVSRPPAVPATNSPLSNSLASVYHFVHE